MKSGKFAPFFLASIRSDPDYIEGTDHYKSFLIRFLNAILLACFFGLLVLYFAGIFEIRRILLLFAFITVTLVSRWATRFGSQPAAKILTISFWLLNSLSVYAFAGIHSAQLIVYPTLIALGGWALGSRWLIGLTVITSIFLTALGVLDSVGLYHPLPPPPATLAMTISISVLILTAFLIHTVFVAFTYSHDRITELAFFDQLTGLPNRTLILNRLKQNIATSSRSGDFSALLMIDLDNFKTLNDTLGHDMGDLLLKQVVPRLTRCLRECDTVARIGGDEFMVMLIGLNANERDAATSTEVVAEKILAAFALPYELGDTTHRCTASIGGTLFKGKQSAIDDILKQADLAMYKSKKTGGNAFHFFDPEMQTIVMERAAIESDLRKAIDERQFLLHYQAQINKMGEVIGAEVLVRWQHPQRGLVYPNEFIYLMEETGLILPLGRWIMEAACIQLAKWASRPELAHLTLAVNVSTRQFDQIDFTNQILNALHQTGADPKQLKLELTESVLVHDPEEVIYKMTSLKEVGIGFSLDDFGTGYSSLSYLSRLPLDQLKIDRSFVSNILPERNAAAICAATIGLAHNLKLKVVAEGVETEAQLDFLSKTHHCDLIQGYLFSRPLPLEEFEKFAAMA